MGAGRRQGRRTQPTVRVPTAGGDVPVQIGDRVDVAARAGLGIARHRGKVVGPRIGHGGVGIGRTR